jgi:hypothetical protein
VNQRVDSREPPTVSDTVKWQKADVIACPEVAGYNDRRFKKGKTPPKSVTLFPQNHRRRLPTNNVIIVSKYELDEKSPGVFS